VAAVTAAFATAGLAIAAPGIASAQEEPELVGIRCTTEDYPDLEVPDGAGLACLELSLTGGEATFGSLSSTFDQPIKIRQVFLIAPSAGPGGIEIIVVPEGDGSGPTLPTIEVPGGLLAGTGLEPLAPLTHPVTGVSATLLTAGPMSASDFDLAGLFTGNGRLATVHLPLAVQINNLLLGDTCMIGSEADPINLDLGLNLEGQTGVAPNPVGDFTTAFFDMNLADDAFAIPGANSCGLLVGPVLSGLGLGALNPFDYLVNGAAGTPSPEENNHVSFDGSLAMTLGV
jgi:hypothetical protein